MSGLAARNVAHAPPASWTAGAMVLAWAAAAAAARVVGIWLAIGPVAVVLAALWLWSRRGEPADAGAWRRDVAWGVPAGLGMVLGTRLLYGPALALLPWLRGDVAALYAAFDGPGRAVASVAMPVVVICEELVWRGAVFAALPARLGPGARVALATLLYAAAHAPIGSPGLVMAALGAGLCWTALRAWTGRVGPAIVAHLAWDAAVLLAFPLPH